MLSDKLVNNENCLTCALVMYYFTRASTRETIFIVRRQYNIVTTTSYNSQLQKKILNFIELQLCTDKKKLMKKKVRRGLKEEDPGSASETDSAMEDSSSGEESKSDDDEHLDVSNNLSNAKEIIETLSVEGGNETPLKWLKKCFDDEKEDREEDSDFQDVPILPMTEECIVAMERTSFTNFLKFLQLTPPNDQVIKWYYI